MLRWVRTDSPACSTSAQSVSASTVAECTSASGEPSGTKVPSGCSTSIRTSWATARSASRKRSTRSTYPERGDATTLWRRSEGRDGASRGSISASLSARAMSRRQSAATRPITESTEIAVVMWWMNSRNIATDPTTRT